MLMSRSQKFLERSESGVGNFGKAGVGVRCFTSDSATLFAMIQTCTYL